MTWRDDGYYDPGWHLPGGIVRFKETIADRLRAVARQELRADIEFEPTPLAINEVIHPTRKTRGHFISLLFKCSLLTLPDERIRYKGRCPKPGEWMWHESCPDDIISVHIVYRMFL